jgi:Flp pilus assembly protein TadD
VRAKFGGQDAAAIAAFRALADDDRALEPRSAASLVLLARQLNPERDRARAESVLRRAWRQRPDDFWVNHELGLIHWNGKGFDRAAEAVRFFSNAVAIRPRSSVARAGLGSALYYQGELDEAIVAYREAIRLKPDLALAHISLGSALQKQGKLKEAIAAYREAIRLEPAAAGAYANLGGALQEQGKLDDAIAAYGTAIRLKPDAAGAYTNLGGALYYQGKLDDAIASYHAAIRLQPDHFESHYGLGAVMERQSKLDHAIVAYREAIRLKPDDALAHTSLGTALREMGELDEAIDQCREAIRLKPDDVLVHTNLGTVLRSRGDFAAASAEFRKALELAKGNLGLSFRNRGELMQTDHDAHLAARLLAVIRGDEKPKSGNESLELAYFAHQTKRFAVAAQLFAEALRSLPWWTVGLMRDIRYHAACCAALAGAGKGIDEMPLDEKTKAHWRNQAVEWLKADLGQSSKQAGTGKPEDKSLVGQTLREWKSQADLAGIRDDTAVNRLAEDEQKACRVLWAEVDTLLRKVDGR